MSCEVPAGIRATIARWGRQKRRVWSGKGEWYLDSKGLRKVHVDGYAASFMGKLMEEREGAGQGARRQHWDEVLWGDGLDVQRVIAGMPETAFMALHLRYVFDPEFGLTMEQKGRLIDMKLTAFKDAVRGGEWWIWARLTPGEAPTAQVVALIGNIVCEALQTSAISTTNYQTGRATPELKLEALRRSKLSIAR
jgi:hypothetical protein